MEKIRQDFFSWLPGSEKPKRETFHHDPYQVRPRDFRTTCTAQYYRSSRTLAFQSSFQPSQADYHAAGSQQSETVYSGNPSPVSSTVTYQSSGSRPLRPPTAPVSPVIPSSGVTLPGGQFKVVPYPSSEPGKPTLYQIVPATRPNSLPGYPTKPVSFLGDLATSPVEPYTFVQPDPNALPPAHLVNSGRQSTYELTDDYDYATADESTATSLVDKITRDITKAGNWLMSTLGLAAISSKSDAPTFDYDLGSFAFDTEGRSAAHADPIMAHPYYTPFEESDFAENEVVQEEPYYAEEAQTYYSYGGDSYYPEQVSYQSDIRLPEYHPSAQETNEIREEPLVYMSPPQNLAQTNEVQVEPLPDILENQYQEETKIPPPEKPNKKPNEKEVEEAKELEEVVEASQSEESETSTEEEVEERLDEVDENEEDEDAEVS